MKYIIDNLNIRSGIGRHKLSELVFTSNVKQLEWQYDIVEALISLLDNSEIDKVRIKLSQIRDIHTTIKNIRQRVVLNDIELFEIKSFCITCDEIRLLIEDNLTLLKIPQQHHVINILDPEKKRVPTFYIYDEYSKELSDLRMDIKKCFDETERSELIYKCDEIENSIRKSLSKELRTYITTIESSYGIIGELDLGLAKAEQAHSLGFCRPHVCGNKIEYKGLFNPQVKELLTKKNKTYQATDILLSEEATILTGANMTGKTVLMKTLALAQNMCQMGFFVPAYHASLPLFDGIELCIDDNQNELTGLSSYAAEILNIDRIVKRVKGGSYLLILIDELARTTNPEEGRAIVSAVATILSKYKNVSLISTHYSSLKTKVKRLRMKGLSTEKFNESISIDNINDFVDYSIIEDDGLSTTNQALLIAQILGVDSDIISLSKEVTAI